MTANQSNLTPEQRLDAMMQAEQPYHTYHDYQLAFRAVALDLLLRLDAAETPCVWVSVDGGLSYLTQCGGVIGDDNRSDFCPGCGHPVQVKQEEDSHA